MKSIYLDSEYPQPIDGGSGTSFEKNHEFIDYLPNTNLRIWYSSKNAFYPTHWHEAMEIIFCQSGYYVLTSEEESWKIHMGDILLMPGGITHSLDLKGDCHGFVYLINLEVLEHMPSAAGILPLITHPIFLPKSDNALYQSTTVLLEQMRNEYFSDNNLREMLVYSHMLVLLAQIGRSHLTASQTLSQLGSDKKKEYIEKFNEILNYINSNYAEDITLDFISKKFGFSKYYFSRLFNQYTTYNFSDYLTYRRVRAAESLLLKSDLPITVISFYAGFNSISTFSRAFKEKNHCSPSDYRRLHDSKHTCSPINSPDKDL